MPYTVEHDLLVTGALEGVELRQDDIAYYP